MLLQVSDARRAPPPGEQAVLRPQRHALTPAAGVAREDAVTRGVKSVTSYVIFSLVWVWVGSKKKMLPMSPQSNLELRSML